MWGAQPCVSAMKARHSLAASTVAFSDCLFSAAASALNLQRRLDERNIEPNILINNAAFGLSGEFLAQEPERLREMLSLDILTLTELTHLFGKRMAARGSGHILLVASLAAYQPDPLLAAYGAAKHFVLALGIALHVELAPKVGVTVVSPGLMDTEFNDVSGFRPKAAPFIFLACTKGS